MRPARPAARARQSRAAASTCPIRSAPGPPGARAARTSRLTRRGPIWRSVVDAHSGQAEHQAAPRWSVAAGRRASAALAVTSISSVAIAIAWPNASAPGWLSRRKMAIGHGRRVGPDDEQRGPELAQRHGKSEAAPTSAARLTMGRSICAPRPRGRRTEHRGGVAQALVDGTHQRHRRAYHEWQRDERVGDRDEQRRDAQMRSAAGRARAGSQSRRSPPKCPAAASAARRKRGPGRPGGRR